MDFVSNYREYGGNINFLEQGKFTGAPHALKRVRGAGALLSDVEI